jgi:hypothetical protein
MQFQSIAAHLRTKFVRQHFNAHQQRSMTAAAHANKRPEKYKKSIFFL